MSESANGVRWDGSAPYAQQGTPRIAEVGERDSEKEAQTPRIDCSNDAHVGGQ